MTEDVFSDPNPDGTEGSPEPQATQDILEKLVGEGKKFATVQDLAKGKVEADNFIEQLKTEQKELRDLLRDLENKVTKSKTVEEVLNEASGRESEGNQSPPISTEDIVKLVDERLTNRNKAQEADTNRVRANAALLKHFNNDSAKARDYVKSEAARLGMDTDTLKEISEKSPDAFLRLVGINNQARRDAPPNLNTAVNSDADGLDSTVRDAAYYSALRKKLGHKFYEPDIQQQRMRDVQSLGNRFYNK
jgi:hypothetical protein